MPGKRWKPTATQRNTLLLASSVHGTLPSKETRDGIARQLGVSTRQVTVWFQNQRQRGGYTTNRPNQEDCEVLRRNTSSDVLLARIDLLTIDVVSNLLAHCLATHTPTVEDISSISVITAVAAPDVCCLLCWLQLCDAGRPLVYSS